MGTYHDATKERALDAYKGRSSYCCQVITGRQSLSGSDLRGKAARYGASYYHQRCIASNIMQDLGASEVYVSPSGRRIFATPICVDDYGRMVLDSDAGLLVPTTRGRVARLSA